MATYGRINKKTSLLRSRNDFDERMSAIRNGLVAVYPCDNDQCLGYDYGRNKLNYRAWDVGTSGSQPGFTQNGQTNENAIVIAEDPFGNMAPIWRSSAVNMENNADGGWQTTNFNVDPARAYRYSVWIRRTVIGNGTAYFGCKANSVRNLSDSGLNSNPYFWYGTLSTTEWRLYVAVVWPHTKADTTKHADSGIYEVKLGRVGDINFDFKWDSAITQGTHRAFLYYSTNGTTVQDFCYPRVDLLDGTEPTIEDLLMGEGNVLHPLFMENCVLTHDGIAIEGESRNQLPSPEFDINPAYSTPGLYKPGWDTSLHSDAVVVNNWSSGYNPGVPSPTKGYHARWIYDQLPGMRAGKAVLLLEWRNSIFGLTARWMGVARTFVNITSDLGWASGDVITVSWYQMSDVAGCNSKVGLYHYLILTGTTAFESNIATATTSKAGVWERKSLQFTLSADYDFTKSTTIYVYGDGAVEGRTWIRDIKIEKKVYTSQGGFPSESILASKGPARLRLTSGVDAFPFTIAARLKNIAVDDASPQGADSAYIINFGQSATDEVGVISRSDIYTFPREEHFTYVLVCRADTYKAYLIKDGAPIYTVQGGPPYPQGSTPDILSALRIGSNEYVDYRQYMEAFCVFSDITIWNRELSEEEALLFDTVSSLDFSKTSPCVLKSTFERENLLAPPRYSGNYMPDSGILGDAFSSFVQTNCLVTVRKLPGAASGSQYVYQMYRPANLTVAGVGNTMWGGLKIILPEAAKLVNHKYRVRFWMKGRSSCSVVFTINAMMGWGNRGINLPDGATTNLSPGISAGVQELQWKEYIWEYTIRSTRWSKGDWYFDSVSGSDILTLGSTSIGWSAGLGLLNVGDTLEANPNIPAGATILAKPSSTTIQISAPATGTATNILTRTNVLFDTALHMSLFQQTYESTGVMGTHFLVSDISIEDITDDAVAARVTNEKAIVSRIANGLGEVFAHPGGTQLSTYDGGEDNVYVLVKTGGDNADIVYNMSPGDGFLFLSWDGHAATALLDTTLYSTSEAIGTTLPSKLNMVARTMYGTEGALHWLLMSNGTLLSYISETLRLQMLNMGSTRFPELVNGVFASYVAFGIGDRIVKEALLTWTDAADLEDSASAVLHDYF